MARFLKPLVRSGGYYPSRRWTPLVYPGGYTTANGGEEPAPPPIEKTVIGNPIHILDALAKPAQALSIALEPIQDLHGYDNPWPAGGGKNLLNIPAFDYGPKLNGVTWSIANGSELTAAGTATSNSVPYSGSHAQSYENAHCGPYPAGTYTFIALGYPFVSGGTRMTMTVFKQDGTKIKSVTFTTDNYETTITSDQPIKIGFWCTVSAGDTVDFTAKLMLTPATDTSYAPYSNICPISGHTDADVVRTGVNLWDEEWELGGINSTTGENIISSSQIRSKNFIPVKPEMQLYIKSSNQGGASTTGTLQGRYYNSNKQYLGYNPTMKVGAVVTVPQNCFYIRFACQTTYGTTYNHDISINYPSTDTDYHSGADNTTYSITFPSSAGTVYGGTLDVLAGKLTITHKGVDMGSLTWNVNGTVLGGTQYGTYNLTDKKNGETNLISSMFYAHTPTQDIGAICGRAASTFVACNSTEASVNAFKTAVTGQTLVYELATPIEITLTPTQIEMLLGENNLWSDAGDSTLTYYAEGEASTSEALGILLGGTYNNPGGADDVSDDEALEILLGGS